MNELHFSYPPSLIISVKYFKHLFDEEYEN